MLPILWRTPSSPCSYKYDLLPPELACIANQPQSFTASKWDLNCNLQVLGPLYQLSYEKKHSRSDSNFTGMVEPWLVQSSLFFFLVIFHASVRPYLLCICGSETKLHSLALDGVHCSGNGEWFCHPCTYYTSSPPSVHPPVPLKSVSNFGGKTRLIIHPHTHIHTDRLILWLEPVRPNLRRNWTSSSEQHSVM